MPNVLLVAYVSQGVALGYGQHLGFQPAPIIYRAFCKTPLLAAVGFRPLQTMQAVFMVFVNYINVCIL